VQPRRLKLKPATLLTAAGKLDAFRRPERLCRGAAACEADARGRTGRENEPYPQAAYLKAALAAAARRDAVGRAAPRLTGPAS